MPSTIKAMTVRANRNVCVRVLETLSSTNATPAGRSVTDSRRFTLITGRQLLSVLIRRQWPSPARSLACIRDRNRDCQPESCGTDRTFQRVFQSAWTRIQPALSVLSRHPKPESAGLLSRHPQRLLDRRSEEHTSELQSQFHLVCRLLL